jgi:large subunit ribosomal protein L16
VAEEACRLVASKLPIKVRLVKKHGGVGV